LEEDGRLLNCRRKGKSMTKVQAQTKEPDLLGAEEQIAPPAPKPAVRQKNAVAKIEAPPMSLLAIIARIASDPSVDTDKMRAVIEIQRDTEAKQQFHDGLIALDEDLPQINKDGKIEFRDTTKKPILFASFENLNRQIKPLLRRHGFRLNFQPDVPPSGQGVVVHCHLTKGLYRESCTVPVSVAPASPAMNAQQSVGAAISYAKRYGAIALLNIETEAPEDRDTDATAVTKAITDPQAKQLLKAIDDCGIEATRFMEKYKISAVHELPAALFNEAMKACKDYGERAKGAQK
jgi:ERF superfamily